MCAFSFSNPALYYFVINSDMPNSNGKIIDYLIFIDISIEGSDSVSPDILQDRMLKTLNLRETGMLNLTVL